MNKSFQLQPLLDLAQNRTDTATRELGALTVRDIEADRKLQLLIEYREHYRKRFQNSLGDGLHAAELGNYREFMSRLDQAIEQQRQVLATARENVAGGIRKLQQQQRALNSYDTLADRHRSAQRKIAENREQKTLDEHAANLFRRSNLGYDVA